VRSAPPPGFSAVGKPLSAADPSPVPQPQYQTSPLFPQSVRQTAPRCCTPQPCPPCPPCPLFPQSAQPPPSPPQSCLAVMPGTCCPRAPRKGPSGHGPRRYSIPLPAAPCKLQERQMPVELMHLQPCLAASRNAKHPSLCRTQSLFPLNLASHTPNPFTSSPHPRPASAPVPS
jgi:hypothetical protein